MFKYFLLFFLFCTFSNATSHNVELIKKKSKAIIEKAKESRYDLKIVEQNLEIAKKDLEISKASLYPTLSGFFNYNTRESGAPTINRFVDPDNPFEKWLTDYKTKLDSIQANEQNALGSDQPVEFKANTYLDCMNCHMPQVEIWRKTSQSIAFQTLVQNKASNHPQCIKCHSLLYSDSRGFSTKDDIIQCQKLKSDVDHKKYWEELNSKFKGVKSIRDLNEKDRYAKAKAWHELDKKFELDFNYANVQCLNCHNQSATHVFDDHQQPKVKDYSSKCIKCHTQDQSTQLYKENHQGLANKLKKDYVEGKIKEIE